VSTQHVGVRKHRSEHLDPRDVGVLAGMPITSPARTLLDLASSMPASNWNGSTRRCWSSG